MTWSLLAKITQPAASGSVPVWKPCTHPGRDCFISSITLRLTSGSLTRRPVDAVMLNQLLNLIELVGYIVYHFVDALPASGGSMFRNVKFTDTRAVSPKLKIIVRNTYNTRAHLLRVIFCFLLSCMCIFYFFFFFSLFWGRGAGVVQLSSFFFVLSHCFITLKNNLWVCLFLGLDDSLVLANDASMISQLNSWLSPKLRSSYSYWKLCYRASVDGWRSRTFHNRCDNKGATVTIVKVGSYIFGGYNDNSWQGKFSNMVSMAP